MRSSKLCQAILAGVVVGALPLAASAQDAGVFPARPLRMIVPVAPGGGLDTTARSIAQKMTQAWGQQVIVDNRTGASGVLAFDIAIKAAPDGYTLLMMSADHVINSAPETKRLYDIAGNLTGVSQATALSYLVYSHPSTPAASVKELIAYGRNHPGKLNFGTPGTGSLQHLGWEMVMQMTGAKFTHVPYKGGAPAIVATVAGEMQFGFITLTSARPHMQAARIRLLAVTSAKRMAALPDLPTVAETGVPGFELNQYYGAVIAARVPQPIVRKLSAAMADAVKAPDVVKRFEADGWSLVGSTPEQFNALIREDLAKWRKVMKDIGLALN